jgi:hypothetical protein
VSPRTREGCVLVVTGIANVNSRPIVDR